MITIKPFQGLRPRADIVAQVASKPYDVLNSAEAKTEAGGNPYSFLYISKPEINFDAPVDPYADAVYEKGKERFGEFIAKGWLVRDETPCLYIYEQTMDGRTQTGLVAGSWIDDYFADRIKKHELTLVAKENDRIRHMKTKMAQPGMVFLTYRPVEEIDAIIAHYTGFHQPVNDFTDSQAVRHRLWKIDNPNIIAKLCELFGEKVPCSYIADGHHRSAAAAKVGKQLRDENPGHTGSEAYNFFLSCLFPSDQLRILDYNRLVKDLNGHSVNELLSRLQEHFTVEACEEAYKPADLHEFSMYTGGHWYKLNAKGHTYDPKDPIGVLDVTILSKYVLDPLLGIKDQRTDKRIDFVGGIRGLGELQRRVDSGEMQLAFAFYPVTLDQLMDIADTGHIMPPKSTWFEPKLKTGLVINLLQD